MPQNLSRSLAVIEHRQSPDTMRGHFAPLSGGPNEADVIAASPFNNLEQEISDVSVFPPPDDA